MSAGLIAPEFAGSSPDPSIDVQTRAAYEVRVCKRGACVGVSTAIRAISSLFALAPARRSHWGKLYAPHSESVGAHETNTFEVVGLPGGLGWGNVSDDGSGEAKAPTSTAISVERGWPLGLQDDRVWQVGRSGGESVHTRAFACRRPPGTIASQQALAFPTGTINTTKNHNVQLGGKCENSVHTEASSDVARGAPMFQASSCAIVKLMKAETCRIALDITTINQ